MSVEKIRLHGAILTGEDFAENGLFAGVPHDVQERLIEFVNGTATHRESVADQTLFVAIEAARLNNYSPEIVRDLVGHTAKKTLARYNFEVDEKGSGKFRNWEGKLVTGEHYETANFSYILGKEIAPMFNTVGDYMPLNNGSAKKANNLPDVSKCSTKVEADKIILAHLKDQNIPPTHKDFNNEFQRIRQETGVNDLPTGGAI